MRVGMGYDVHKLVIERDLIIGGVKIDHEFGLLGHSDADVLLHAIMDAIIGAMGLGDIGRHFPDSDDQYKGISSMKLLGYVKDLMGEQRYWACNIDATIVAQSPKMAPYIPDMVKNIAASLGMLENHVNIKATTEEHLGFTGRKEGIAAYAVVLLEEI